MLKQRKTDRRKTIMSEVKSKVIRVRFTPDKFNFIKRLASSHNMTMSLLIESAISAYSPEMIQDDIDTFFAEITSVCRKHGFSISHEDGHSAFSINLSKKKGLLVGLISKK